MDQVLTQSLTDRRFRTTTTTEEEETAEIRIKFLPPPPLLLRHRQVLPLRLSNRRRLSSLLRQARVQEGSKIVRLPFVSDYAGKN